MKEIFSVGLISLEETRTIVRNCATCIQDPLYIRSSRRVVLSSLNDGTSFSPLLSSESENSMAAKWLMSRAKKVDLAPGLTGAEEALWVREEAEKCPLYS